MKVTLTEFNTRRNELVRLASAGERVVITSHGRAVADLVPHVDERQPVTGVHLAQAFEKAPLLDYRRLTADVDGVFDQTW